jgi:hypothetical protein
MCNTQLHSEMAIKNALLQPLKKEVEQTTCKGKELGNGVDTL